MFLEIFLGFLTDFLYLFGDFLAIQYYCYYESVTVEYRPVFTPEVCHAFKYLEKSAPK